MQVAAAQMQPAGQTRHQIARCPFVAAQQGRCSRSHPSNIHLLVISPQATGGASVVATHYMIPLSMTGHKTLSSTSKPLQPTVHVQLCRHHSKSRCNPQCNCVDTIPQAHVTPITLANTTAPPWQGRSGTSNHLTDRPTSPLQPFKCPSSAQPPYNNKPLRPPQHVAGLCIDCCCCHCPCRCCMRGVECAAALLLRGFTGTVL